MSEKTGVDLEDIALAMHIGSREIVSYLNKKTWEKHTFQNGREMVTRNPLFLEDVADSPDYMMIANEGDTYRFRVMERFTEKVDNAETSDRMVKAMFGKNPREDFREALPSDDLEEEYEAACEEYFLQAAEEWCKANGVPYEKA